MSVTIHGDIVSETRNSTRCPGGSGGCQRNALLVTKRGFFRRSDESQRLSSPT